jgi:hypothetical protein
MITLKNPISVTPPPIGEKTFEPILFDSLSYSVMYDNDLSVASVNIRGINRPMKIWEGADYATAAQWTDGDVEKRILELLGDNPGEVLADLFVGKEPYVFTPPNHGTVSELPPPAIAPVI